MRASLRIVGQCLGIVAGMAAFASAASAQGRVVKDDRWCDEDDSWRYCEVREIPLTAGRPVIAVDGGNNGGIRVEGWDRNEILVRVKVSARARSEEQAEELVRDVTIDTETTIRADGPRTERREWWAVSFEIFVPRRSNLTLETHNGGIDIDGVMGTLQFEALNGGVHLAAVGGDVRGSTTNGGLHIELEGDQWEGEGLDVRTTNGGVHMDVPRGYSAHLVTGTVNGGLSIDFPVLVQGRINRELSVDLGGGGKTVRALTTNGGVRIKRG